MAADPAAAEDPSGPWPGGSVILLIREEVASVPSGWPVLAAAGWSRRGRARPGGHADWLRRAARGIASPGVGPVQGRRPAGRGLPPVPAPCREELPHRDRHRDMRDARATWRRPYPRAAGPPVPGILTPANAAQHCAGAGGNGRLLVVEIIPQHGSLPFLDNSADLGGFITPRTPLIGDRIRVTGPYVLDTNELHDLIYPGVKNWAEIHPAWNITIQRHD